MLKVITLNANGIRSAFRKGAADWLLAQKPEIICIQETKAQLALLDEAQYQLPGYHCFFSDAEKRGYSGVAIYSKQQPDRVLHTIDAVTVAQEGRYVQADFANLSVVSLYLPSGSSGDQRQQIKFTLMEQYDRILQQQLQSGRDFIICGDWNIVHTEKDIKNFKSNQKTSGCLPEERAWIDRLFSQQGWVDAFRVVNQQADQYTWWSNRGQAWARNVGWRIDYQIVTPGLHDKIQHAEIYTAQRFSDHAPLSIDYAL